MSNQSMTIETINTVTHNNIPVLTTELLANFYQTEVKNIQQNYKRNEDKFFEGKHYFKLSGSELAALRPSLRGLQISSKTRSLILWTERGAARHAKMLDTDQAWEVFEKLEDSYFSSLPTTTTVKTTVDQRTPLRDAVNLLVSKKALTYSEAYSIVHQRFNVASIEDLPQDQLSQAVEYVHKVALEGEFIAHQKEQNITLTLKQFYDLAWVCNVARYMHRRIELITPALNAIKSDYHGTFREMTVSHRTTISEGVEVAKDIFNKYHIPIQLNDGRYFPNLEKVI